MAFGVTGSNASKISHTMSYMSDTVSIENHDLIYLLPSKDVYETGEDLWFKAWQFNRSTLGLSGASQTLYLRLYAPTDSLVWDEKYPLADGRCSGHVYVDEN